VVAFGEDASNDGVGIKFVEEAGGVAAEAAIHLVPSTSPLDHQRTLQLPSLQTTNSPSYRLTLAGYDGVITMGVP
jgi:hypothetical protein